MLPSTTFDKQISLSLTFDSTIKKCILSDKFLSFSLDTLELKRKLRCFPLSSTKINTLVRALAPAYFRVGGTPQDFLIFSETSDEEISGQNNNNVGSDTSSDNNGGCTPFFENWSQMKPFRYTIREFDELFDFAARNEIKLIFGLNALSRTANGDFAINNVAKKLLSKYGDSVDWEIGNEPNRFNKYGKKAIVKPKQLARDQLKLRKLLSTVTGEAKIYGPDISKPSLRSLKYLKRFLAADPQVDAVTYHLYDMHQADASLEDFFNPIYLSKLEEEMSWIEKIVRNTNSISSRTEIWVGETGSASGGGAPGLSDKFVSGFNYIGKIGLASEFCHKVLIRQSLYGGYYGMLDPLTHDPLPDFWITALFKRLARSIVLDSVISIKDSFLRTHVYCSKTSTEDVIVMFSNFRERTDYDFQVRGYEGNIVELFLFTSPSGLQSSDIYLNGERIEMKDETRLPHLRGFVTQQSVVIPRRSYGFIVVRNVNAKACS